MVGDGTLFGGRCRIGRTENPSSALRFALSHVVQVLWLRFSHAKRQRKKVETQTSAGEGGMASPHLVPSWSPNTTSCTLFSDPLRVRSMEHGRIGDDPTVNVCESC